MQNAALMGRPTRNADTFNDDPLQHDNGMKSVAPDGHQGGTQSDLYPMEKRFRPNLIAPVGNELTGSAALVPSLTQPSGIARRDI